MESGQIDRRMMRRALALATLGRGTAAPNPFVGAVVARGATVLGQGFHRLAGEPHAEAIALSQVGSRARGATLYTNLEPCCHTGRTPPCVDEIVLAGVRRVVASMRDPNRKVDGGGFRYLRKHGIEVEIGLLRREAKELNAAFVKQARRGLPYVTLKGAMSLDGRIATRCGDSKWITSKTARRHARVLRAEHDAVLVGIGTAIADDPRLNRRPEPRASGPFLRAVLDGSLRLSPTSRLVQTARRDPVIVFCGAEASAARKKKLRSAGVTVESIGHRGGRLDLEEALFRLSAGGVEPASRRGWQRDSWKLSRERARGSPRLVPGAANRRWPRCATIGGGRGTAMDPRRRDAALRVLCPGWGRLDDRGPLP